MVAHLVGLVAALALLESPGAARPEGVVVEVDAGPHRRHETPVVFACPEGLRSAGRLVLEDVASGTKVDAQLIGGESPRVVFILQELTSGSRKRYRLTTAATPSGASNVSCLDDGKAVSLRIGKRTALKYNYAMIDPPKGIDPVYRRSGFIHPLATPSGRVVTADFPPDHAHQHGLFFAWVNTTFAGHRVDFWNQKEQTGRVRHLDLLGTEAGQVFAQFRAALRHEDITGRGAPVPVLDEVWTVRVYAVAGAHVFDFESRLTCAGARPLELNKYLYGGLGLRCTSAWFDPKAAGEDPPDPSRNGQSDFLTSEGKTRASGNHTRPRWVDLSGKLDGAFAGVAILGHPGNFRFPQPVRLHPNKPYLSVAPEVVGAFRIEPGRPYVSRYRLVLHDGAPVPENIEAFWRDYAEPPTVRVVAAE
jgi:Methane oxygenase PmoA